MNIESHRISKFIEALLSGQEIKYQDKTYIVDEDLRVGYCVGEIFYELPFSNLVYELSKLPEDIYVKVCFYLAQNKSKSTRDELDILLDSDIDSIVDKIHMIDKIDELGDLGIVSLGSEESNDNYNEEFIDSLLKELEEEGNKVED